jgi:hypothetical protein
VAWAGPESLGAAPLGSDPCAVSWGPDHIDVFWRGTDGALWHKWFVAGWYGPESLGAAPLGSDPQSVSWGSGHIHVFWRGTDGALWQKRFLAGWAGPQSLGAAPLGSDPQPVSWGPDHIDVFWRGNDAALWHKRFLGVWAGHESLGAAPLGSTPRPVSWGNGHVEVFWRGTDGALWHKRFLNGSWQKPESLGAAPLGSDPRPVSWGPEHIDVFWRGSDGGLWHRWFLAGSWYGPESLGASPLASEPRAVSWGNGHVDVFWRGTDDSLWHKRFLAGSWQSHEWLGAAPLGSTPTAVSWRPQHLDVFWRGTDGALWHRRHGPPTVSSRTAAYVYTMDRFQRDMLITNKGYASEAIAGHVKISEQYPIWRRLHPLFHPQQGDHFYTADNGERYEALHNLGYVDEMSNNLESSTFDPDRYPYWSAYIATSQQPGTVALHRLRGYGGHYYTSSEDEREAAVSTGWTWEEVAGWIYPAPQSDTRPLFRLVKVESDPPFPANPTKPTELADHGIAWSQLRDQRIMSDLANRDAFKLEVGELSLPANVAAGGEVEFWFGVGPDISAFKEIRLFGADKKPFGQDRVPQDAAGKGVGIADAPGYHLFVGRYPVSQLVGSSFVFTKAKAFGVPIGMYQLRLDDVLWLRGKKISFTWLMD